MTNVKAAIGPNTSDKCFQRLISTTQYLGCNLFWWKTLAMSVWLWAPEEIFLKIDFKLCISSFSLKLNTCSDCSLTVYIMMRYCWKKLKWAFNIIREKKIILCQHYWGKFLIIFFKVVNLPIIHSLPQKEENSNFCSPCCICFLFCCCRSLFLQKVLFCSDWNFKKNNILFVGT